MKNSHNIVMIVLVLLLAMAANTLSAQSLKPKFKVSSEVTKQLIVETIYTYRVMKYEQPVTINLLTKEDQSSYSTPEDAVAAHFSAMYAGNHDWFMNSWTKDSQIKMRERDISLRRTPEFWLDTWKKILPVKTVQLVTRIESGSYVFIEYQLVSRETNQPTFHDTLALKDEDGKWRITQELAADPVLAAWNAPVPRIQQVGR